MKYNSKKIISLFYKEIKDQYPHLTFYQIEQALIAPWTFARQCMDIEEMPIIQYKYFGKFQIFKGSAKKYLNLYKVKLDKKYITQTQYDKATTALHQLLNSYEKTGRKH